MDHLSGSKRPAAASLRQGNERRFRELHPSSDTVTDTVTAAPCGQACQAGRRAVKRPTQFRVPVQGRKACEDVRSSGTRLRSSLSLSLSLRQTARPPQSLRRARRGARRSLQRRSWAEEPPPYLTVMGAGWPAKEERPSPELSLSLSPRWGGPASRADIYMGCDPRLAKVLGTLLLLYLIQGWLSKARLGESLSQTPGER